MDALLNLLGLLVHWRAVAVFAAAFLLGTLVAGAVPSLAVPIVGAFIVLGAAGGIALEARHIAKISPSTTPTVETTSSRVVAMLGFAAIGAVPGWLITPAFVALGLSLLALAAVPLLALTLVSASQATKVPVGTAIAAVASSWAGFLLSLSFKVALGGANAA